MMKLKVLDTIKDRTRISSVDIFRSIAIITVVLYHFNHRLPFGYLGVDLFFVISGLLVGGLLTKEFRNGEKINFFKFILQRGFKIWPSYYAFMLFGTLLAIALYSTTNPDQVIPLWDMKRYLLFYQNYTGQPFHWSFDHVWSLCVEEHFYIMLPILFLIIQYFIPSKYKTRSLFVFVVLTILAGIIFKFLSYYFTNSKDTYSGTHNRIDALAWGVLLNLLISYYGDRLKAFRYKFLLFASGLILFAVSVYIFIQYDNILFNKLCFHSIVPFSFFLMLAGAYYTDLSGLKPLRVIAYYSYNWYLWHPVFVIALTRFFGNTITGLLVYLVTSFTLAVFFTIMVEETFLGRRKIILDKIFPPKKKKPVLHEQPV